MADPGLVELATAEEESAKRLLFWWLPACHCASAALTVAALFTPLPWPYVLAAVVLAMQGTAWHLRREALRKHRLSDQARRRALLITRSGRILSDSISPTYARASVIGPVNGPLRRVVPTTGQKRTAA